jgi:hypothetical protein
LCNPCEGDEEKDDKFVSFLQVMEHRWNEIDREKSKPVPVPLCPPQIPHGLTRDRTRASVVGGRGLTAYAMARSLCSAKNDVNIEASIKIYNQPKQFFYVLYKSYIHSSFTLMVAIIFLNFFGINVA